jgi:hypothetical protein
MCLRRKKGVKVRHRVSLHRKLKHPYTEEERREFLNWLSDIDFEGDHDANSRNILKGSGNWMLRGEEKFRSWKDEGGLLWLCGIRQ